jgi:hypothetical protein
LKSALATVSDLSNRNQIPLSKAIQPASPKAVLAPIAAEYSGSILQSRLTDRAAGRRGLRERPLRLDAARRRARSC